MNAKPDVLIHIGPMKTGTTALGYYFSVATEQGFLPPSILYPTGDLWFPAAGPVVKHNALFDFFAESSNQPQFRKTPIQMPADVETRVARVAAAAQQAAGSTVVFVSETLSSRTNIALLLTMLRKYFDRIRVVFAVRSPVAAEKSMLVHRIKDWRVNQPDFDIVKMMHARTELPGERYARVLDRWSSFSDVELVLLPYFEDDSDGYASVDRFYAVVAGAPAPRLEDDFGSRRLHPSLPRASLTRLILLKNLGRGARALPPVAAIIKRLFSAVLGADREKTVARGFEERTEGYGEWQLSPAEESAIRTLYAPSYAAVRKMLGPKIESPDWQKWHAAEGV